MPITFYDNKMAPSPRRARIMLAEKNVPHETVEIDMLVAQQMSEEYRKINPNCTLPALKLDNRVILTENSGIAVYLEETFPNPPLLGRTTLERAEVASWQTKLEFELGMPVANALRNINPMMKNRALPGPQNYPQIPELAERGQQQFEHFIHMFEAHLQGKEFVVGTNLTVADITAACFLDFARVIGKKITDTTPNIRKWKDGLKQRPSFQI